MVERVILELLLPLSLILPGLWILQITKFRAQSNIEQLSISYILSLATMFVLLYFGSLINAFNIASFIFLAIMVISTVYLITIFAVKNLRSLLQFVISTFSKVSAESLTITILTVGLVIVYAIILHSRAILDSDVVQYYLPIAREISTKNALTYNTGYDYNILLKAIGGSFIYAWTFEISGSTYSEVFRLMPLTPLLIIILLNYAISKSVTKSPVIATISTILFLMFPFHDRFLLYNAFYPDMFYYPLIFAAIYFLIKYHDTSEKLWLFWIGITLGTASLLKTQTVYFLISFILLVMVEELKNFKRICIILISSAPLCMFIPNVLDRSIKSGGFQLFIPPVTKPQLLLLLYPLGLSLFVGILHYLRMSRNNENIDSLHITLTSIVKKTVLILLPFMLLSSLWYGVNFAKFGSIISTSQINLPNYDWALQVLNFTNGKPQLLDVWNYLAYFSFIFIDPAVMGYALLIPCLIGTFFALKSKNFPNGLTLLLVFTIILASLLIAQTAIASSISEEIPYYNPRDILPFAPLLTTTSAIGLLYISKAFKKTNTRTLFSIFLMIAYFGLINYAHSVMTWYVALHYKTATTQIMSILANIVGLNLAQTSFQLPYNDRPAFIAENAVNITLFSLVVALPILIYHIYKTTIMKRYPIKIKVISYPKMCKRKNKTSSFSKTNITKYTIVICLLLSVLLIPRIEMLIALEGTTGIKENQLRSNYGYTYNLISNINHSLEGNILTFKAPMGLVYYLPHIKIIDLNYPANLAFLKGCFQTPTPYETVVKLSEYHIKYLLINPHIVKQLDQALNFTFSKITADPELATLSYTFGSWQLYTLGPYTVERTSLPLSEWTVSLHYTNASYIIESGETSLYLKLYAKDIESRVTIFKQNLPKLNLSNYDYIIAKIEGSANAQILIRFWLSNGTGFDLAHWDNPYTINFKPFDLHPFSNDTFRGELYISLKSSDGQDSYIRIIEISFIKVNN